MDLIILSTLMNSYNHVPILLTGLENFDMLFFSGVGLILKCGDNDGHSEQHKFVPKFLWGCVLGGWVLGWP